MEKKKIIKEEIQQIIDSNTGEVIEQKETTTSYVERESDYVKLYLNDIVRLNDLAPRHTRILMEVISAMGYKNVIALYSPVKKLMCKNLNIKMDTLDKAIQNFAKKGILFRIERGVYLADPDLFGRGKWEDIKDLQLLITYDVKKGKRTLKSNAPELLSQTVLELK